MAAEAIDDLTEAIRLRPLTAQTYLWRGRLYAQRGERAAAQSDLSRAIDIDAPAGPGNRGRAAVWIAGILVSIIGVLVLAAFNSGLLSWRQPEDGPTATAGPIPAAVASDHTTAEPPPEPGTITGRQAADEALKAGNEAFAGGDYATALEQYASVTRLTPHFASAFVARANTYTVMGDNDRALSEYQAAIDADSSDENARLSRGMLLWMMGRLPEAEADLRKAIELDPADKQAYEHLATVLADEEKKGEIPALFEAAYQADTTRSWALRDWLDWLREQKAWDEIFEICDEEESNSSHPAEVALFRGLAEYETGKTGDALTDLEEAIRLDPYELGFRAHEKLFLAYKASNRLDDCIAEQAKYAELLGRQPDPTKCQEASP